MKRMAKSRTTVRAWVQKGHTIIETQRCKTRLAEMLAAFDPKRHGGEVMAFRPLGKERL